MKKAKLKNPTAVEEIKPEYDFSAMKKGARGKYFEAYREGHKVIVHQEDGAVAVQYFKLEDGAVMLEPDVRKYFHTSEVVNKVLRTLIEVIPAKGSASGHQK